MCGCGHSFNFVGRWLGNRNLKPKPGQDPRVIYTIGRVELWVEDNGRFKLSEGGVPKDGTIHYRDNKAFLRATSIFMVPMEQASKPIQDKNVEMILTPQPDGTILFEDPGDTFNKPVKLNRESQPSR
jgi:hypothetical protein